MMPFDIKMYLLLLVTSSFLTSSIAQNCSYAEYYSLFELATEQYQQKKYNEAEKNIKLALEKIEFPLGEGLQLALMIAQKQDDHHWAEDIAIQIAKGGVPLRYFRYLQKFEWFKNFKSNYHRYAEFYNENFNPELKNRVVSLIDQDKEFNRDYHDWRNGKITLTLNELVHGAYGILNHFKEITDAYGFPTEQKMGYYYDPRTDRIKYYQTDALLIHIYQRGVKMFEDQLKKIICRGGLHPSYEKILKNTQGYGNSTGIEQEMEIRYAKHSKNK